MHEVCRLGSQTQRNVWQSDDEKDENTRLTGCRVRRGGGARPPSIRPAGRLIGRAVARLREACVTVASRDRALAGSA